MSSLQQRRSAPRRGHPSRTTISWWRLLRMIVFLIGGGTVSGAAFYGILAANGNPYLALGVACMGALMAAICMHPRGA